MIHLTAENVIITGGYTASNASFAPRKFMNWTEDGEEVYDGVPINQGFMSALNHQGDLVWGNYFYNNSYPIYSVTGCKTNPSQSMVIAMGLAQVGNLTTVSRPYLMTVNKATGAIDRFLSIWRHENVQVPASEPIFSVSSSLHYDDSNKYEKIGEALYMGFTEDSAFKLLKIGNFATNPTILWEWKYANANTDLNVFRPHNLHLDELWVFGQIDGVGGAIRFNRDNMHGLVTEKVTFPSVTTITDVDEPLNYEMYHGCGYDATKAGVFRMKYDAHFQWFIEINGDGVDKCMAIDHSEAHARFTLLIETSST